MQEGGANESRSAAPEEKKKKKKKPKKKKEAEAVTVTKAKAEAEAPPPLPPLLPPPPPVAPPPLVAAAAAAAEAAPEEEAAATAAAAAAEAAAAPEAEAAAGAEEDSVISEQPEAATMVKIVGDLTEFRAELSNAGSKLIVVDFSATWCGPCKMIKPFFHSMVEKYPEVVFIEIDVDDAQDVASHCDVKCMPTFQFYKNNEKVHEFSGANKEKLEEAIKKYM
ncbi:thioredoxin domain-containing protein 2-like [Pseudonaja textilis]|uniref:Thioredoxin n=1 Tax=Pseudonaja textilis TaxID=8673 RepID=A0A670ZH39_PSETE|nr:thioredoxin domain-containing protein 2-like [Pseudonaja textilis]